MSSGRITVLAAACLLASAPPSLAATDAQTPPEVHASDPKRSGAHHAKARTKHTATHESAAAKPAPSNAEQADAMERAASLERRRKAFFANKPDESEPTGDGASAPFGFTLGGSGGLKPEMGLKF